MRNVFARLHENYRLGIIAALLIGFGLDSVPVPFFNERLWFAVYVFLSATFLGYWYFYNREWLLRSTSLMCGIYTIRALSFAVGGRLGPFCSNMLIAVLVWIIFGLRAQEIPRDDGGA